MRTPATTLWDSFGLAARRTPNRRMMTPRPAATHTAPKAVDVRSRREKAMTQPATMRNPARGTSKGAIIRRRTCRFTSGSPVARSDQARTIHSTTTPTRRKQPTMKSTLLMARPSTTRPQPKAPVTGQYDTWAGATAGGASSVPASSARDLGLASRLISEVMPRKRGGHADGHQERVAEVVPDGAPVAGGDRTEPVAAGAVAVERPRARTKRHRARRTTLIRW